MIDRFLKSKGMKGVIVSNTQYRQLNRLLNFMVNDNEKTFRKQNTYKILPEMIKCGVDNFYIERFRRVSKLSRGLTLYKLYLLYGRRNGKLKWDNYRLKQANSNSFEYKNKKYGMSYEEFVNYNKSRSTTLENMILKYGESEGTIRYNSYIEKQRINGVKLEYFVNKYGHDKGLVIYNDINKRKSNSAKSLMKKYKDIKYVEDKINSYTTGYYSNISQEFILNFIEYLKGKNITIDPYYATSERGIEYGMMGKIDNEYRYYRYDFVDLNKRVCIEFHGDHYHANPKIYNSNDKLVARGVTNKIAKDVWEEDNNKKYVANNRGFCYYVVWESDWNEDKEFVLEDLYERIYST